MGSANGCCKNPKIDNNTVVNGQVNQNQNTASKKYGGAWGDTTTANTTNANNSSNGHVNVSFTKTETLGVVGKQNGSGPPQNNNTFSAQEIDRGPPTMTRHGGTVKSSTTSGGGGGGVGVGVGSRGKLTEVNPVKNGKSKAIGSVALMLMNSFSQQPRDLLIHLGVGSQMVRPASFVKEDEDILKKMATDKRDSDINARAKLHSQQNEDTTDANVVTLNAFINGKAISSSTTDTGPSSGSTLTTANPLVTVPIAIPFPRVPSSHINSGAVSRLICTLNMIPNTNNSPSGVVDVD